MHITIISLLDLFFTHYIEEMVLTVANFFKQLLCLSYLQVFILDALQILNLYYNKGHVSICHGKCPALKHFFIKNMFFIHVHGLRWKFGRDREGLHMVMKYSFNLRGKMIKNYVVFQEYYLKPHKF